LIVALGDTARFLLRGKGPERQTGRGAKEQLERKRGTPRRDKGGAKIAQLDARSGRQDKWRGKKNGVELETGAGRGKSGNEEEKCGDEPFDPPYYARKSMSSQKERTRGGRAQWLWRGGWREGWRRGTEKKKGFGGRTHPALFVIPEV